jgi:DNA-binding XRE family transcriptional regulator
MKPWIKEGDRSMSGRTGNVDAEAFLEKLLGPLTFGGMLKSLRKCEEMSLSNFAYHLGVSRKTLSEIERGLKCATPERAAEWALKLGL